MGNPIRAEGDKARAGRYPAPPFQGATWRLPRRSFVAHTLKPLERDGLLAVAVDPADRRNRLISLTQQGRAKLAETDVLWAKAQRCFEAAFRGAESESLREALRFCMPTGTMTNQVGIRAHAGTTDSLLEGEAFETSVPVRDGARRDRHRGFSYS